VFSDERTFNYVLKKLNKTKEIVSKTLEEDEEYIKEQSRLRNL